VKNTNLLEQIFFIVAKIAQIFFGPNCLAWGKPPYFCLGRRFSKHKM